MQKITSKRVDGNGKGTEIGFPTINFILDELPSNIELGLYAIVTNFGKGMSLISKYKGKYRIETHIMNKSLMVKVGQSVDIYLLDKLRDPIKTHDVKSMIKNDTELSNKYFTNFKTCLSCQLCYIEDYGYSNYTVEGSNIGCYANKFEQREYSRYNGLIVELYKSNNCNSMIEGDYWELDVDGESERPSDSWILSTLRDVKINKLI